MEEFTQSKPVYKLQNLLSDAFAFGLVNVVVVRLVCPPIQTASGADSTPELPSPGAQLSVEEFLDVVHLKLVA